ncbi:hypothetical protein HYV57_03470 [Candidatus Peregrinibacteria bacterium]|nr:hypothetical protein [Candidatus Peregrinibacteria bacterium]
MFKKNLFTATIALCIFLSVFGYAQITQAQTAPTQTTDANIENWTFNVSEFLKIKGQEEYTSITQFIVAIINFVLKIVAAVIIGIIVIAGLRLIVSNADENSIQKGKEAFTSAILGLLIVLAAYVITLFVQGILYKTS